MTRVYNGEDGTSLRFYYDTAKNNFQSEQNGAPVFDKVLKVEVLSPGSKESIPTFELTRWVTTGFEEDGTPITREKKDEIRHERYRRQIAAFIADGDDPELAGTPLSQWGQLDITLVETLKEAKVFTVEALANVPDNKLQQIAPGMRALRERAKAWLVESKGGKAIAGLTSRVGELEEETERLKGLLDTVGGADAVANLVKENEELKRKVSALETDLKLADAKPAGKRTV